MNILTKTILLTLLLFLSGCAHHSGYYSGHSSHAAYGVSIDAYIPYRSYNTYHDDAYLYKPRKRHYSHYLPHYNEGHHDRSGHYKNKKHSNRGHKKDYSSHYFREGGRKSHRRNKDSRHGKY